MSEEARRIIFFMCKELSTCKYVYESIVEGCYDTASNNHKMIVPIETKEWIVKKVISVLNAI